MRQTKIEWCDHTFNPWWGCVKVSPGCANCYAEAFDRRAFGKAEHVSAGGEVRQPHWGKDAPRRLFGAKHWREPLAWNEAAKRAGVRRRVFCASMADVFEGHPDTLHELGRLARVIESTPFLDWLLLTKRPRNAARFLPLMFETGTPSNVWVGTSVESEEFAHRARTLVEIPHAGRVVRFVSYEPALGPVRWGEVFRNGPLPEWIIVGGESGAKARPFDVAWARAIVEFCREAGIACFVKQFGSRAVRGETSLALRDPKGGDPSEWYHDLRVREWPKT